MAQMAGKNYIQIASAELSTHNLSDTDIQTLFKDFAYDANIVRTIFATQKVSQEIALNTLAQLHFERTLCEEVLEQVSLDDKEEFLCALIPRVKQISSPRARVLLRPHVSDISREGAIGLYNDTNGDPNVCTLLFSQMQSNEHETAHA